MRILATTDFHGHDQAFHMTSAKAIESHADVVAVCGDVTHFGSMERVSELLNLLREAPCVVLFIPGNCDPPQLAKEEVEGLKLIHGKCERVRSVDFLGVGGSSPSPFNTPFELGEVELAGILEEAYKHCESGGKLVLVSHDPPKDTKVDMTCNGEHVGSSSVREFIERVNPTIVLCGHIHEAAGVDRIGDTILVNPGPARHGRFALVDLDGEVKVKLDHF